MALLLLFVLLNLNVLITQAQISASIYPKEDYNAPLDPEMLVQFNCTSTRANIEWRVNDTIPSLGSELANKGVIVSAVEKIAPEMFASSLSIPARGDNDNTVIRCKAIDTNGDQLIIANSKSVLLNIQGLLLAPPNLALSEADGGLTRVLSWDAPETLNITNVDPDIQSYRVCYNLTDNFSTCINISSSERREFKYLNVYIPLLFTVSAINVVGEGDGNSLAHLGNAFLCDHNIMKETSGDNDIKTHISLAHCGADPVVVFTFNQTRRSDEMCFYVYKVQTILTESNISHGAQIPQLSQQFDTNVQLELTISSRITANTVYSAVITRLIASDDDEVTNPIEGTVEFSTYDVQSVSGSQVAGGLELSCKFAEGSQAQSCTLTICKREREGFCKNISIPRNLQSEIATMYVNTLPPGLYNIIEIAEVEHNGTVTLHSHRDLVLLDLSRSGTFVTPDKISTNGRVSYITSFIYGGSFAAIFVVITIIVTAIIFVILLYLRRKSLHKQQMTYTQEYDEPNAWVASQIPFRDQQEPDMEECPAYGIIK